MDALEELSIAKGDTSRGLPGDAIGLRIWYLRIWMVAGCVLGSGLVFGVKSGVRTQDKEKDLVARDYLLMLIFPAVVAGVVIWGFQGFEAALLQTLVGVDWPSKDTNLVDDLITIDSATKTFADNVGRVLPISLFAGDKLPSAKYTTPDGKEIDNSYYPEADVSKRPWDAWPDEHENARKNGRIQSGAPTYQLKQLFDSASVLAAILAMAFVNVDSGDAKNVNKDNAKAIFKDWNLDFRTDDEWNFLMSDKVGDIGVIPAATQWLKDISATPKAVSRLDVQLQMTQTFGLASDAYDKRPS
jgi:hypothetical protein